MSDAEWDADDFEPTIAPKGEANTDKWEGEDEEDDDVKESWDTAEATGGDDAAKAVQKKKKKKLSQIIAEKEAAKEAELEALRKAEMAAKAVNTPEGKAAEKLRLLKMEENANLQLAKDMLGLKVETNIDSMIPVSKEEFDQFRKALTEKISLFSNSEHFADFVEILVRDICVDLSAASLKKVKINVETLHSAKLKDEKAALVKKKKGKGGTLKMDTTKDIYGVGAIGGAEFDDLDDFM